MNAVETTYHYRGFQGCHGKCGLRITPLRDGRVAVICTELPENPGTSVTNFAEGLAAMVCAEFGINPAKLVWIEHYAAQAPNLKAQWDRVTFQLRRQGGKAVLASPEWRPMREAEWQARGLPPHENEHR